MKRVGYLLFALLAIVGCTQTEFEFEQNFGSMQTESISRTRAIMDCETDSVALQDSIYKEFFVPYLDARIYAAIHCRGENAKELDTIVPMTDGEDTLMYLVQYKNGWEVIAADKRGPLVVAMSENGNFEMDDSIPGLYTYIEAQKMYLKYMRKVAEHDPSSEAIRFWSMLHPKNGSVTRNLGDGYWELYDCEYETTTAESGHLIQTKWGQDTPWNALVPYNVDNTNNRCAVGCVAVAGAQMLYFLHHKIGYPLTMYTQGGFSGNNNSHSYSFSNPTASAWDNMALNASDTNESRRRQSALLMAYVGSAVDMNYGTQSSADTENLIDVFDYWGISSTLTSYNSTTAWNSLKGGMPVIVRAADEDNKIIGIHLYYSERHAWIMDGWKTVTTNYTYYYGWVSNSDSGETTDPGILLPMPDNKYVYTDFKTTNSTTVSKSVLMNWGWDGLSDNIYYSLDGAWSTNTTPAFSFQYDREMIHGFRVK